MLNKHYSILRKNVVLFCIFMLLLNYCDIVYGNQNKNVRIIFDIKPQPENEPVFNWLDKEDICWGIEVPWHATESDIRNLRSKGWEVLVHLHAHPETLKRHWEYKGREVPDINAVMQKHVRAAKGQKGKVNWMMFIEDDSCGVGHSQDVFHADPKTYGQAKELLEAHLQKAHSAARSYPELPKWGMCGFATSTHNFASSGLDWLILERANDDVDDLQTGIAFARGAASQYGCNWGLDLSLWWGVFNGCIQNLPSSFHKRHLYLGYFSGAKAFRIEGGDLFWDHKNNRLVELAKTVRDFSEFSKRILPDEPDVPVAIILPEDHGWMTPPYWRISNEAWNYSRIPYRPGDRGIDSFFSYAYPGSNFVMQPFPFGSYEIDEPPASPFSLSCVTPRFAPNPEDIRKAAEPIPFGRFNNRNIARKRINTSSMDPSPYRPMGDSRWGDVFDILTTEAEIEALSRYKVLILLGQIELNDNLKRRLTSYVSQGGIVVCTAGVIGPEDRQFTGLHIQPEFRVARSWNWQNQTTIAESFHYLPAEPVDASMNILAQTSTGRPLITRHQLGKGSVYSCTVPWYEGPLGQFTGPALRMIDNIIEPIQPVVVQGLPVEWLSTHGPTRKTVLVANHNEQEWKGLVTVRNIPGNTKKCVELLTGKVINFKAQNNQATVKLKIPRFDIRILRWE
ncbi:MAG: type 1 glutamine amidotransferase family protein [Planctomycetota bacterium]